MVARTLSLLTVLSFAAPAHHGPSEGQVVEVVAQRLLGQSGGTLTFEIDGKMKTTRFWERSPIPAGTYNNCSATLMKKKQMPGIFIPDVEGRTEIFIHSGNKPEHSDGCLVIPKNLVDELVAVAGRNKRNITVHVRNASLDSVLGDWTGESYSGRGHPAKPAILTISRQGENGLRGSLAINATTQPLESLRVDLASSAVSLKFRQQIYKGSISTSAEGKRMTVTSSPHYKLVMHLKP